MPAFLLAPIKWILEYIMTYALGKITTAVKNYLDKRKREKENKDIIQGVKDAKTIEETKSAVSRLARRWGAK